MNVIDKKNLKIFKKIDQLNLEVSKRYSNINLISIFLIKIQQYLSCSIISIYDKRPVENNNIVIPQVDREYLKKNKKILSTNLEIKKKLFKYKQIFFSSLKKDYDVDSFNVFSLIFDKITEKKIKCYEQFFNKIYLEDIEEQKEILFRFLIIFQKTLKIKNKYFAENFLNYIENFITYKKQNFFPKRNLLVGTNMNIENRIMSAHYLMNNKKVISFNHTNYSPLIYNNPFNEAGEFAFCNYYVDYGKTKFKKIFLKADYLHPKIIKFSIPNSLFLNKKFKYNNKSKKMLYYPDSFHGYKREGPFRDVNDKDYYNFQNKLMIKNNELFLKKHPKENQHIKQIYLIKFVQRTFDIIDNKSLINFKYFIVDRISQVFFKNIFKHMPMVYLDMGVRNLNPRFKNLLKKNLKVIKSNIKKATKLPHKVDLSNINKKYNNILNYCSLSKEDNSKYIIKLLLDK